MLTANVFHSHASKNISYTDGDSLASVLVREGIAGRDVDWGASTITVDGLAVTDARSFILGSNPVNNIVVGKLRSHG